MKILVTLHAAQMYRQRICRLVDDAGAEREIMDALRRPLFRCPANDSRLMLWGCINCAAHPFLVATDLANEGAPFLLVRTVGPHWFWHEAKREWRQLNTGSRRHFRC